MHHPCFFDFFGSNHADDGFRLGDGLFSLLLSGGIAAEPRGVFFVSLPSDIHSSSNAALASKIDRGKKLDDTNHSGFDVKVK
jgi:hypothetical protein